MTKSSTSRPSKALTCTILSISLLTVMAGAAMAPALGVVRSGDYREYEKFSGSLYIYSRSWGEERLLVVCCFCERPVRFRAPKGFDLTQGRLILKNYDGTLSGNGFVTRPFETRVYYFGNETIE